MDNHDERIGFIPLLIVVLALSVIVNVYVGDLALSPFNMGRWKCISLIVILFMLMAFLLDLLVSLSELKNFKDIKTGSIRIVALWKKVFTNPLNGFILIAIMTFGITGAQDLSEYFRVNVTIWYDANLWALESPVFKLLKGSVVDIPRFWDVVYFAYWPYLMLVFCALYRIRRFYDLTMVTIATVLSFYFTRWIAILYPAAGPAFYKPELFNLPGTLSGTVQKWLVLYMKGGVPQNGLIPGTMGMPSLHIGVTVMAAYFLARHVKWTLWLSVLWACLLWMSTVILGWHYVLDGVGGIAVAAVAVLASRGLLMIIGVSKASTRCPKQVIF